MSDEREQITDLDEMERRHYIGRRLAGEVVMRSPMGNYTTVHGDAHGVVAVLVDAGWEIVKPDAAPECVLKWVKEGEKS